MRTRSAFRSSCTAVAVGALALLCPGSNASAQTGASAPPPTRRAKLEVDARLAYGIPFGDLTRNSPLADSVAREIPLAIGAGVRAAGGTFFGASLAYGVLAMKEGSLACPAGWSKCGGHHVRVALDFLFHLRTGKPVDPWLGFSVGYQWLSYHASLGQSAGELTDHTTLEGTTLFLFQLGIDFALDGGWALGPFAQVTMSYFDEYTVERTGAATGSASGTASGQHGWLVFGVRGSFTGF